MKHVLNITSLYKLLRNLCLYGACFGLFIPVLCGQDKASFNIVYMPEELATEWKNMLPNQAENEQELRNKLRISLDSLQMAGWLEASVDSFSQGDSVWRIQLHIGERYTYATIELADTVALFLRGINKSRLIPQRWRLNLQGIHTLLDSLAGIYEDSGYPFAKAILTDFQLNEGDATLRLGVESGNIYTIKELINSGEARISGSFLARYSGLRRGSIYSRQGISRDLPKRLRDLPYVSQRRDPVVQFGESDATVHVFLNKRNASRFDFILGALPGNVETGRLIFTGTAHLELHNQFGAGERTLLSFQRLRPETQELRAEFSYPYLLDLPFGIDLSFGLYARDTTNRDLVSYIGLSYLLPGGSFVRAFWKNMRTELVGVNTQQIINSRRLPQNLDVRNSLYGIEWLQEQLDYRFNPRKGWRWRASVSAGTRQIIRNSRIVNLKDPNEESFEFGTLYDPLNLKNWQLRITSDFAWFLPLGKLSTLQLANKSGWIQSPGQVFRNELFRIGGNSILRGFDEESIFSGLYQIGTLEYRLLTGQNSYLFAFTDVAWLENATALQEFRDFPYGFGFGMTFETSIGVFGLTLAQGAQRGNPIDFRATKLHFGYVSIF